MKVLNTTILNKYDAYNVENCKVIRFKDEPISTLNSEICKWFPHVPVVIMAGTGAGKTTWICKELLPKVTGCKNKMLLLVNRTALNEQTKKLLIENVVADYMPKAEYAKLKKKFEENFENNSRGCCDLERVVVMTVQAFAELPLQSDLFNNIGSIVVDEAHYFKADALFNNKTALAFNRIFERFPKALKIFISATPQNILPNIIVKGCEMAEVVEYYEQHASNYDWVSQYLLRLERDSNTYYRNKCVLYIFSERDRAYNFIPLPDEGDYKKSLLKLIEKIKQSIKEDKFIFFINNKEEAKKICNSFGDDAVYIDADSKKQGILSDEYVSYKRLILLEKFDRSVLICTSVFDNGVNFRDSKIKGIFVDADDYVTFKQMLGRVRLPRQNSQNYSINVYFINYSKTHFEESLKIHQNILAEMQHYLDADDKREFLNNAMKSGSQILKFLSLEEDGEFLFNSFAKEVLENKIESCKEIIAAYNMESFSKNKFSFEMFLLEHVKADLEGQYNSRKKGREITVPIGDLDELVPIQETTEYNALLKSIVSSAVGRISYLDRVACWFGRRYEFEDLEKAEEEKEKLKKFLDGLVNNKLDKEGQENFKNKFLAFYNNLTGKKEGAIKSLQSVKYKLLELNMPYDVVNRQESGEGRKTIWILEKINRSSKALM